MPLHLLAVDRTGHFGPAAGNACAERARPLVLAATIVASAMAFIDGSVVSIAIPAIQRGLSARMSELQWVVTAYLLLLGALVLVGGGLGDRVGRRRVFLIGITIFGSASLLCAAAASAWTLIAARALQGVGAALLVPQSLSIIAANFPERTRGRAIGTWAAASAITTSLGPPLGGVLIDSFTWRAAFWINLPLSALALWLTWRFVPESRDPNATGPIDWRGAVLATTGLGLLTYGLSEASERTASARAVALAVLLGLGLVAAFAFAERHARNPITPPELFRSRVFTGLNVATVFLYGALSGVLFLLPFDLLARRGLGAARAGLTLLPLGLIVGIGSRFMGGLADRHGARIFLVLGAVLVSAGCLGFVIGQESYWSGAVLPVVVIGAGMALAVSPLTTAVMNAAPEAKAGAASGVSNAASRLAGVLAVAIFGATASLLFLAHAPSGSEFGVLPPPGAANRNAVEAAFRTAVATAMIIGMAWALVAAVVSFVALKGETPGRRQSASRSSA